VNKKYQGSKVDSQLKMLPGQVVDDDPTGYLRPTYTYPDGVSIDSFVYIITRACQPLCMSSSLNNI
jgi:hypothetical protein